jgi:hypothetical protein
MATVLFVHGMGAKVEADADRRLELLRQLTPHTYLVLFYGDVFERIPAYIVARDQSIASPMWETPNDAYVDGYVDGYIANMFGFGDEDGLALAGEAGEKTWNFGRSLYMHATRYMLGRKVYVEVRDVIKHRFMKLFEQYQFSPGSLVLLGYSLGSVVSLDLLHDANFRHLFARFVSVGSPLGCLGILPHIPLSDINVLSDDRRSVHVDWVDVAISNDPIVTKRITAAARFQGRNHPITPVNLPAWQRNPDGPAAIMDIFRAHAAYFSDESLARQWINHLSIESEV